MKKVLSIVDTAYRATIEEQDDTVLWFNHILKNCGGDISILLSGSAVSYAVKSQSVNASLGNSIELRPPQLDQDVVQMIAKGITVYLSEEDALERGMAEAEMIEGIQKISKTKLPGLLKEFDQIWHW